MPERISSLDPGYQTGDLSLFPETIDDKDSLFEVRNNAETTLRAGLPYNSKYILVEDASKFPDKGILCLTAAKSGNSELIYYGLKAGNVFKELVRGYAATRQNKWDAGTKVTNAVSAQPHNALKDALLNIEAKVGEKNNPDEESLNGLLKALENKHLAPKAQFRAFPRKGFPPLAVRFQSFSSGDIIRYLWDFGDGAGSIEKNPTHTYQQEGIYSVKLNVITSGGAQGIVTKSNYVTVSDEEKPPFFYTVLETPNLPAYSIETANALVLSGDDPDAVPAVWSFVDQTDGDIVQRFWVFDDGQTTEENNPSKHFTTHVYEKPGVYSPSLMTLFSSEKLKRVFLQEDIVVL